VCDAVAGMIVYSKIPFEELGEHSIYGTPLLVPELGANIQDNTMF